MRRRLRKSRWEWGRRGETINKSPFDNPFVTPILAFPCEGEGIYRIGSKGHELGHLN